MRCVALLTLLAGCHGPVFAQPIPATRLTVAGTRPASELFLSIEKRTGITIQTGSLKPDTLVGPLSDRPMWAVLESLAAKTGTHLSVRGASRTIAFESGPARTAAAVDGAFRIAANSVTAKSDVIAGDAVYTLSLDVQWEPRFPVFRIDAHPRITIATDDRGQTLTARTASVKSSVVGYSHAADIRMLGLTRSSTAIAKLEGEFAVTASPKLLAFDFSDLGQLPATKTIDGVTATVVKLLRRDRVWEIQLTVDYPADPPKFESFESWTNRNTIQLIAPDGKSVGETENEDIVVNGKRIQAAYRYAFKTADLSKPAGWRLVYASPAPLVEFPVKFQLKDIALP